VRYHPASPLAIDAEPFHSAVDALRWAFAAVQERGSGAWCPAAVPQRGDTTPRPCEPVDVIRVCDMVIEKYRLDQQEQTLIVCAGLGTLSGQQWRSAQWQAIEDRLTWYLQAKGIVQRPGGQPEEPNG
jgi:hypothetical protein